MQHLELADYSRGSYSRVFDSRAKLAINRWAGAILILCTLALSACGGGGAGNGGNGGDVGEVVADFNQTGEDVHILPKSSPPGLRHTLAFRFPLDAKLHEVETFMQNGQWPESACLNFNEAGFDYPMAHDGITQGAWSKVENLYVYELPDQNQKIVKAEFVNWSDCNTRTGKLAVKYLIVSDPSNTQNQDSSWIENWISFQPGIQICDDRDSGLLNCEMIGDSGMWTVGEFQGIDVTAGEYLNSVEIVKDASNSNNIKITSVQKPDNLIYTPNVASVHGIGTSLPSIPVTEETELFFTGYKDRLIDENAFIFISVAYGGSTNGSDPCKSKLLTYVFGNRSFDKSYFSDSGHVLNDAIVIGSTDNFSRKIFQDLSCSPSEFLIGHIAIHIGHSKPFEEDTEYLSTNNWVSLNSIGIR